MQKNKIFISYRQSDTQSEASRLKENLEDVFGAENVFFDIETLEPGLNFAEAIEKTIRQSAVVLVLIGEDWAEVKDEQGNLRLFKEDDWVRREVAMALAMENTRVIPVLVKDAKKLDADQLPDNIKSLADYQWAELTIPRWRSDVERLVASLKKIIQPTKTVDDSRPYSPPPTKPKSWWAKNYLWVLGIAVILIIIASFPTEEDLPFDPGTEILDDEEFIDDDLQQLNENNLGGTEIQIDQQAQQDEIALQPELGFDYSGKWWLFENGVRSGYFLISQNGQYFNFDYYYFDQKRGQGTGEYDGTYLYSTGFNVFGDTNLYAFTFGSNDMGESWTGQTFVNSVGTPAYLIRD